MLGPRSSVDRIPGAARDEVGLWRCNEHDVPLEVFDDKSLYCPADGALFEVPNLTRQLSIVHLSDVHFGSVHRFAPPATAAGDVPSESGFPQLIDKLVDDLGNVDPGCPVIYALTGDMAQTAAFDEFKAAEEFVRELASRAILGKPRGLGAIFMVPGNHDVVYASADVGERMQRWTDLLNRLYGTSLDRDKPGDFPIVHDRVDDLGAVIATLNSSIYVQKGEPDQDRGRVDTHQLSRLDAELESLDEHRLSSAIRIALIHHHPVLIPSLVEARRGYDAVHNSGYLLSTLRRFGFHLILHGHKHNPHIFTDGRHVRLQVRGPAANPHCRRRLGREHRVACQSKLWELLQPDLGQVASRSGAD
jgi:3',5'-cyclic AMP phosphodiesterase CpdA